MSTSPLLYCWLHPLNLLTSPFKPSCTQICCTSPVFFFFHVSSTVSHSLYPFIVFIYPQHATLTFSDIRQETNPFTLLYCTLHCRSHLLAKRSMAASEQICIDAGILNQKAISKKSRHFKIVNRSNSPAGSISKTLFWCAIHINTRGKKIFSLSDGDQNCQTQSRSLR